MRISDWSSDVVLFRSPGDDRRAQRHRPPLRRARPARQAGIDRRAARRVDDHEQGDEGRDEQVDHWPGAGTRSSITAVMALPSHIRTVTRRDRSEEHTSELQSLMRTQYAVFCLKK